MHDRRIGYEDAYRIVKAARPAVWPNVGFRKQLKEFEKELLEKIKTGKEGDVVGETEETEETEETRENSLAA